MYRYMEVCRTRICANDYLHSFRVKVRKASVFTAYTILRKITLNLPITLTSRAVASEIIVGLRNKFFSTAYDSFWNHFWIRTNHICETFLFPLLYVFTADHQLFRRTLPTFRTWGSVLQPSNDWMSRWHTYIFLG